MGKKKQNCFKMYFVAVSLSLINMSNIKRKQKSPKQQKPPNRIKLSMFYRKFSKTYKKLGLRCTVA